MGAGTGAGPRDSSGAGAEAQTDATTGEAATFGERMTAGGATIGRAPLRISAPLPTGAQWTTAEASTQLRAEGRGGQRPPTAWVVAAHASADAASLRASPEGARRAPLGGGDAGTNGGGGARRRGRRRPRAAAGGDDADDVKGTGGGPAGGAQGRGPGGATVCVALPRAPRVQPHAQPARQHPRGPPRRRRGRPGPGACCWALPPGHVARPRHAPRPPNGPPLGHGAYGASGGQQNKEKGETFRSPTRGEETRTRRDEKKE